MRRGADDLQRFVAARRGLSKNSVRHVVSRYRVLCDFLQGREITPELIEEFIYEKMQSCGNNTVITYNFALRHIEAWLIDRNPNFPKFTHVLPKLKKEKSEVIILTVEDEQKLLATHLGYGSFRGKDSSRLDGLYLCLTRFLATTGCRYQEASSLLWENVNLEACLTVFKKTKNKKERKAYLAEPLISQLRKLDSPRDGLVFTTMLGHKIPPQNYSEDLRLRAKRAGVTKRVHPHLFRHSFATELYNKGVPLPVIKDLLGHEDISTTLTYIHLDDDMRDSAMRHGLLIDEMSAETQYSVAKNYTDKFGFKYYKKLDWEVSEINGRTYIAYGPRGSPIQEGGPIGPATKHEQQ